MGAVRTIASAAEYDEAVAGSSPVLVDFTASWCGPCKRLSPVLDELAAELRGRLDIVKVDVDELPEIATRYRVSGVPTMILLEQGEQLTSIVGARPKKALLDVIGPLL